MPPIDIAPGAHGKVRVFTLSLPDAEAERLFEDRVALARALGVETVDPNKVEVFRTVDLTGVGLAAYLVDGTGAQAGQVERDRARLSALDGWVVVTTPGAFDGAERLNPVPALTMIGAYDVERADMTAEPIESASAQPYTGTPPPTAPIEPRKRGSGTTVIFVGVAILLVLAWLLFT